MGNVVYYQVFFYENKKKKIVRISRKKLKNRKLQMSMTQND